MDEKTFIKSLAGTLETTPSRAAVLGVRMHSADEVRTRAKRFLSIVSEAYGVDCKEGDSSVGDDQTLIRLPLGARLRVFHASAAMHLKMGLAPMEQLFPKMEDRQRSTRVLEEGARKLKLETWVGANESIKFEHLWQIKAAAADRKQRVQPVLCRVLGAYRHLVRDLPVWGPASVTLCLAGQGKLDSLTIHIRETTGEVVEEVKVIRPDQAAQKVVSQIQNLFGNSRSVPFELLKPLWFKFGYLNLSKRQSQRLLAPTYVAAVRLTGEEPQSYVFAVPGSDRTFVPSPVGKEVPARPDRRVEVPERRSLVPALPAESARVGV